MQSSKTPAPVQSIKLEDIVQASTLRHDDIHQQNQHIVSAFNAGNEDELTVESMLFGKRLEPNEFRLAHRNNIPQLIPSSNPPQRLRWDNWFTGTAQEIGVYDQTQLVIGAHGRYVVNVPQGKLAKGWLGNTQPIFLGAGPHVIRHPNFRLDAQTPLVNIGDAFIQHGNYKILRIPKGKIAKIWLGATPMLLESSEQPYVFNDPTFRIDARQVGNAIEYFTDATEKLIEHGSIKRIQPHTSEVAIIWNGGKLETYSANKEPIVIDSATFKVEGFLQTSTQTLLFPSEHAKAEKQKANPRAEADSVNYLEFRTSDGLEIGVSLLVVYEIVDAKQALMRLKNNEGIINHIERVLVGDMNRIILSSTSANFQRSDQTVVKDPTKAESQTAMQLQSANSPYQYMQDAVNNQLAKDLIEWGIKLIRFNIETFKTLNKNIADEMSKNSLATTKAQAEASRLALDTTINQKRAEQIAMTKRIEVERTRDNTILDAQGAAEALKIKAQAELDSAKLKAEAERIAYENAINKTRMENAAKLDAQERQYNMEIAYLQKRADVYAKNETLLRGEVALKQAEALQHVNTCIVSPEVAQNMFGGYGLGATLFSQPRVSALPAPVTEMRAKEGLSNK